MLNIHQTKIKMADPDTDFTKLKVQCVPSSKSYNRKKPYEKNKSTTQSFGPFSLLLNEMAQSLTEEDTSLMKLIIQSDRKLNKQLLDDIKYPADLLRLMHSRNLIQKHNTDILANLLLEIKRNDLFKKLKQYTDIEILKETEVYAETHCDSTCMHEASESPDLFCDLAEPTTETSSSLDSHMSVDDDDDDVLSSQDSVSDEEKISRLSIKASLH